MTGAPDFFSCDDDSGHETKLVGAYVLALEESGWSVFLGSVYVWMEGLVSCVVFWIGLGVDNRQDKRSTNGHET